MSWRERAQKFRAVPLVSVLQLCGAQPDPYDPRKWHTSKGVLTVTGSQVHELELRAGWRRRH